MHRRPSLPKLASKLILSAVFLASAAACNSAPVDESDLLFTNHPIPLLRIHLDDAALAALRINYRTYVKATVSEGEKTYRDVGIHLKGQYGTFKGIDGKPSLTLNFDKFAKGQRYRGLDKFHLNNSAQDPSYLCEIIGRQLFQEAGIPTSRATHARVELNGRHLGLLVLIEGTDKTFLKRHFKDTTGNLYDSGFRHDLTEPLEKKSGRGTDDHSDLHALLDAASEPNHKIRLQRLSQVLELEQFYKFLAMETVIRHHDGYSMGINNYRAYRDPFVGKFILIPHGMDQLFYQPHSPIFSDVQGSLARGVLQTQEGRQRFRNYCGIYYTNFFPSLSNRIELARARLRPILLQTDTNQAVRHDLALSGLHGRMRMRAERLRMEISDSVVARPAFGDGKSEKLTNLVFTANANAVGYLTNQNGTSRMVVAALKPRRSFSGLWQSWVMLPSGTYTISTEATSDLPSFRGPKSLVSLGIWGVEVQTEVLRSNLYRSELRSTFSLDTDAELILECRIVTNGDCSTLSIAQPEVKKLH
jgi:spore coat protein H